MVTMRALGERTGHAAQAELAERGRHASFDEVQSHYIPPTDGNDGGNGSQGRLFEWAGQRWFETNSVADPAPLEAWFADAATAAGEDGCSFEMPVAGAG